MRHLLPNKTCRVLKNVCMIHWWKVLCDSPLIQGPSKCTMLLQRRHKKKTIRNCPLFYVPCCVVSERWGGVAGLLCAFPPEQLLWLTSPASLKLGFGAQSGLCTDHGSSVCWCELLSSEWMLLFSWLRRDGSHLCTHVILKTLQELKMLSFVDSPLGHSRGQEWFLQ